MTLLLHSILRLQAARWLATGLFLVGAPLLLAAYFLRLWKADLTLPLAYNGYLGTGGDAIWQFVLSKVLFDTGWVLDNPFLGAPDVAHWHGNASAQTSAIHSVLMRGIALFVPDAIAMQQVYYLLNFPLIAVTSYLASRALGAGRWVSCCLGLLYAFTTFRLHAINYAYLSNYFVIPLSLLPPIWIVTGRFTGPWRTVLKSLVLWISLGIVALAAVTDGYYAFFTLLLLGFAAGVRLLSPYNFDWRSLLASTLLIGTLIAIALILAWPLRSYERSHAEEFLIDGRTDPVMIKHPFEAEIYSVSLKLMFAPIATHRIPVLGRLGAWMVETSNQSRALPSTALGPLGLLASGLMLVALGLIVVRTAYGKAWPFLHGTEAGSPAFGAILGLVLFSCLCATTGGIGSLIALVYPTIRAYDRLPLFIMSLLYLGSGLALTHALASAGRRWRLLMAGALPILVVLSIFDQMPKDTGQRDPGLEARFLAERRFIRSLEASLPTGTMVYQYPFSQYLTNNAYYGWGAFDHIRLYLHSHHLRWSNGAFKNSPVDQWHTRLAALPIGQLLTEVRAAGFGGFTVDRTVVKGVEYEQVRRVLVERTGVQPVEDEASRLAFWNLPPSGYRLVYEPNYLAPAAVVVDDPRNFGPRLLSRLLNPEGLARVLNAVAGPGSGPVTVERSRYPEAFTDPAMVDRGMGLAAIQPPEALQGDVLCTLASTGPLSAARDSLTLTLRNRSSFDWRLNSGPAPLRVGLKQLLGPDGGVRLPGSLYLPRGGSASVEVPLARLDLRTGVPEGLSEVTAVFALLQEGHVWFGPAFGDGECRVILQR
jgi:hypothetical protein